MKSANFESHVPLQLRIESRSSDGEIESIEFSAVEALSTKIGRKIREKVFRTGVIRHHSTLDLRDSGDPDRFFRLPGSGYGLFYPFLGGPKSS